MPHKGGRKRTTPRKAYAQKAAQKQAGGRFSAGHSWQQHDAQSSPFSMTEAARTTGHRGGWGETKLRNNHVTFVTATSEETSFRTTDKPQTKEETEHVQRALTAAESEVVETAPIPREKTPSDSTIQSSLPNRGTATVIQGSTPTLQGQAFFIDLHGDPTPRSHSALVVPQIKHSPDDVDYGSDSSAEVVVFRGKNHRSNNRQESPRKSQDVRVVEENIRTISLEDKTTTTSQTGTREPRPLTPTAEDEAVADYVANILAQGDADEFPHAAGLANNSFASPNYDKKSGVGEETGDTEDDYEDETDSDNEEDDEETEDDLSQGDDMDSEDEAPDETKLGQAASAMSDEQLARRLAKQEELGLGSDEVLLWGEEDMAEVMLEEDDDDDDFAALDVLRNAAQKLSGQRGKRPKAWNRSILPQMLDELDTPGGDDYGDFDIMDLDRPSLQRRKKKSKELPFAISDSELEANMEMAWENDRLKKKQRKVQREQMRVQGLLGGGENAQLKAKYGGSISMAEIHDEVKIFLSSDRNQLPLIPMDKRSRIAVHEIANLLNLKSKSKGNGFNRHPCLYKTSRTRDFDSITVDAILMRHGTGRGPARLKMARGPKFDTGPRRARGGGGVTSGVTYRDGETVGASAPALGIGNRGHTLLSKMGWTSGTALGALNNKGALEPVPHVVKATRAGLG